MSTKRTIGIVHVRPGTLVKYEDVGIFVNCDFNAPEFGSQPYVTVNTEELAPEHRYDAKTGKRGEDGGMPAIAVHLNDAELYDDMGAGNTADPIDAVV